MKKLATILCSALLLVACTEPAVDTFGNIGGTVSDADTGIPLSGVSVQLTPTGYSQVTGSNGTFQFDNLDVQEYTLTFKRSGYQTYQHKVTVKPGLSSSVQVSLHPADVSKPTVVIGSITGVSDNSVRLHATLSSTGSSPVVQHGFCYAEHRSPTINDACTQLGQMNVVGEFLEDVGGLKTATTYYCRAYAENGAGVAYSEEVSFTTTSSAPSVSMVGISEVTASSARLTGALSSKGSSAVTRYGFCYAESHNPTTANSDVNLGSATATGQFSTVIQGLKATTTYYCRSYAQNASGIVYSDEMSFVTLNPGSGGDIAVPAGLLLYYTFDNGDVSDATEMELDGQTVGNPSFLDGNTPNGAGKSIFLNGSKSQYISIPYNLFKGYSNYSISLWLKDFSEGSIISGISSSDPEYRCYPRLHFTADGKFAFQTCYNYYKYIADQCSFSAPCASLQSGTWHHIVVTCNKNTQKLYIDGVLTDSMSKTWQDIGDYITKVQIGGNGDGKFPVSFTGKVDNVSIYLTFLLDNQIKYLYDNKL